MLFLPHPTPFLVTPALEFSITLSERKVGTMKLFLHFKIPQFVCTGWKCILLHCR